MSRRGNLPKQGRWSTREYLPEALRKKEQFRRARSAIREEEDEEHRQSAESAKSKRDSHLVHPLPAACEGSASNEAISHPGSREHKCRAWIGV